MPRRRRIAPTFTLKLAQMLQELEMEVKFAAAAANFADFYIHRFALVESSLISISRSLFQVASIDVTLNTPDLSST